MSKSELLAEREVEVESSGLDTFKMSIDSNNTNKLFSILSENLYNDPIGSIVREYVSNAFDAHKELGVNDAVEVGFKVDKDSGTYWYCKDVGIGLSPDRIEKVFSKYLSSTKENDEGQIGFWGLGSKSALAYTDAFFIDTVYDGILYKYCMSKGEDSTILTKLSDESTDERNGTTIKIFVGDYGRDLQDFKSACEEQLAYFDNVYFVDCNIDNDYKIYNYNTFLYSSRHTSRDLHICLGKVKYPIDFNVLKINRIDVPLALKFDIGTLAVTPNREGLKYTEATKTKILNKIKEFAAELHNIYNTKDYEFTDIVAYLYDLKSRYKYVTVGESTRIGLNGISQYSPTILKASIFKPLEHLNLNNLNTSIIFKRFYATNYISRNAMVLGGNGQIFKLQSDSRYDEMVKMRIEGNSDPKKNKYLRSVFPSQLRIELIRDHKRVGVTLKEYITNLSLYNVPRTQWRQQIVDFQNWEKSKFDALPSYDDIVVSQDFLDGLKNKNPKSNLANLRKSTGKILIKNSGNANSYVGLCSWYNLDWQIKDFFKKKELIVYGSQDDREKLSNVYRFKGKIHPIITAKTNHKYFDGIEQFIHIDEYMKGNNKSFKRAATALLFKELINKNPYIFNNLEFIKSLKADFGDLLSFIMEYSNNHAPTCNEEFKTVVLTLAKANNLFDLDALSKYNQIMVDFDKFTFLKFIQQKNGYSSVGISTEALAFVVDYLKLKKVRMNAEHYQVKEVLIVEENVEEDTDTDEEDNEY